MTRLVLALCTLVALSPAPARSADASGDYKVLKKITLGGEGGWDYLSVDPAAKRLYISRFDRVMVVDTDSDKVVGTVPNTAGVHILVPVPEQHKGFTSNGRASTSTVVDLATLKPLQTIKVGTGPDAAIYDPASRRVFTFNAGSKDATAIDVATGKVAGTVPLGGKPEFAAADGKGTVYVNLEDKNEVLAFDSKDLKVKSTWPTAPGEEPGGMAMDRDSRRLFVSCGNKKMVVLDADSGKVVETLDIGAGTDAAGFDPGTHMAFSSNRDGTLTIVKEESPDKFEVAQNLKTEPGARTMAVDPTTHRIYLVTAKVKPAPANRPPAEGQPKGRRRPNYEPGSFTLIVVGK
jgi:YVTN family beta-propeller protein